MFPVLMLISWDSLYVVVIVCICGCGCCVCGCRSNGYQEGVVIRLTMVAEG